MRPLRRIWAGMRKAEGAEWTHSAAGQGRILLSALGPLWTPLDRRFGYTEAHLHQTSPHKHLHFPFHAALFSPLVSVVNSTVRGCSANGDGGGLHLLQSAAILTDTAIHGNAAAATTSGASGDGGGVFALAFPCPEGVTTATTISASTAAVAALADPAMVGYWRAFCNKGSNAQARNPTGKKWDRTIRVFDECGNEIFEILLAPHPLFCPQFSSGGPLQYLFTNVSLENNTAAGARGVFLRPLPPLCAKADGRGWSAPPALWIR